MSAKSVLRSYVGCSTNLLKGETTERSDQAMADIANALSAARNVTDAFDVWLRKRRPHPERYSLEPGSRAEDIHKLELIHEILIEDEDLPAQRRLERIRAVLG
jgi:hypothetical protein